MKLTALAFLLLLLLAHMTGDFDELAGQPLSTFRDGPQGWLGYALFAALLLVSLLYLAALVRFDRLGEAAVSGLAVVLLLVVALTPSWGGFHLLCSLLLFMLLFGYYSLLFYRMEGVWLFVHLAAPVVLALVTNLHSYGLWQKSFIAYFVLLAAAHHHLLIRQPLPPTGHGAMRRVSSTRRRKVYQLASGREWTRRALS
jgi:hypothetical protein